MVLERYHMVQGKCHMTVINMIYQPSFSILSTCMQHKNCARLKGWRQHDFPQFSLSPKMWNSAYVCSKGNNIDKIFNLVSSITQASCQWTHISSTKIKHPPPENWNNIQCHPYRKKSFLVHSVTIICAVQIAFNSTKHFQQEWIHFPGSIIIRLFLHLMTLRNTSFLTL